MSLWGNKDSVYSDGTIAISGTTVTGTGTTFNTSGLISAGDIITVGTGSTQGEAIIAGITSARILTLQDADQIGSGVISGAAYNITQRPISTHEDSGQYGTAEIYGVDTTEQGVANAASGNARKYAPPHAGWVGITTYVDTHGNLRVKSETLVAGSTITGDAVDDTVFPDS
mgnify:FL=1|jgi:hypothetical protein|tara:strand:- start:558 stop:1070 length:513 start_codon:yes stop_codon:yes gene_type:complete